MADYPDIYADGFSVSAGNMGLTVTLTRTQPTGEPGPHEEPAEIVARLRCGATFAKALSDTLATAVQAAQTAQVAPQTGSKVKH
jgi:hypothetical protein